MQVRWIVENFNNDSEYQRLIDEIKRQGMECLEVKYVPFQGGVYDQILDTPDECVIFYGSLNLGRQLLREKKWIPAVWCNLSNFRCSAYYPHYYEYLLNKASIFMPAGLLIPRADDIYSMMERDGRIFIRPDSGYKEFSGQILARPHHDEFVKNWVLGDGNLTPDGLTVISTVKEVTGEWRFFVGPEGVICGCTSKENNQNCFKPGVDPSAKELADKIANHTWRPDPLFVVDICKWGGEYYLMEINSFSCSGLYCCDAEPIVRVASETARKEWEDYHDIGESGSCV